MMAFEFGYIELFEVDATNVDELGEDNLIAAFVVSIAVILCRAGGRGALLRASSTGPCAPVSAWSAALIDGLVFGSPTSRALTRPSSCR